jgi:hypothetical protein
MCKHSTLIYAHQRIIHYDIDTFLAWVLLSILMKKNYKKQKDDACISLTVHIFADDIDNIVNDKSGFIGHKHTCFHDH